MLTKETSHTIFPHSYVPLSKVKHLFLNTKTLCFYVLKKQVKTVSKKKEQSEFNLC